MLGMVQMNLTGSNQQKGPALRGDCSNGQGLCFTLNLALDLKASSWTLVKTGMRTWMLPYLPRIWECQRKDRRQVLLSLRVLYRH